MQRSRSEQRTQVRQQQSVKVDASGSRPTEPSFAAGQFLALHQGRQDQPGEHAVAALPVLRHAVLALQHAPGNQAVQRLLRESTRAAHEAASPVEVQRQPTASHRTSVAEATLPCRLGPTLGPDAAAGLISRTAPTSQVQRAAFDVHSKEYFNTRMKNANARRLVNYVPSTGMGKFDAEYLPERQELRITVRLFFDYTGEWSNDEKRDFETRFIDQVQRAWSGKYTFRSKKPGWEEYVATPVITVRKVAKKDEAHYDVTVDANPGRAMVGREGSKPGQISGAKFFKPDVTPAPHRSQSIRCSIATHEAERIKRVLFASRARTIFFDKSSAEIRDPGLLDQVAAEILADKLPGAPRVSLKTIGWASKSESKGSVFRRPQGDLARRRAQVVANYLRAKLPGYDVVVTTQREIAQAAIAEAQRKKRSQRAETRRAGERELAVAKKLAALKSGADQRKVEIGVDETFAERFEGDPYSVAVHEFGHMLGNPDEYFAYGKKTLDLRIQQLLESQDPRKVAEAINLLERKQTGSIDTSTEGERADIQANYAMLVRSAGLEIPAFGSTNSSLMSAGTDLLPRHYVALWEALARITEPTISQGDWVIGLP